MFSRLPVTVLLLIISVTLNVALSRRVTTLRDTITYIKAEKSLKIGQQLPEPIVSGIEGQGASLRFSDARVPTILYVFSPSCGWCAKNLDNIRALNAGAGDRYRVVGVSLTTKDLPSYVHETKLSFPIYVADQKMREQFRLGGTPQTLLVSPEGRLLRDWRGAYQSSLKSEIEKETGVQLPGLLSPPVKAGL